MESPITWETIVGTIGGLVTGALGLITYERNKFVNLSSKLEDVSEDIKTLHDKTGDHTTKLAVVETKLDEIERRLSA